MTKQLSFLQKIDRAAKQKKLEGVLESVRLYRQFGLDEIGTHTLRKTYGYHMYMQTKNIA
ncbi:hypothetical protein F8160_04340 [Bacillus sp. CH126_4D]|nr:hypothetical protein F8162_21905 [Bacillus sp. CH140a_4T]KAB2474867.1 hypothetical protein F8160_04340 [Bacillus sp. CH126_4D]